MLIIPIKDTAGNSNYTFFPLLKITQNSWGRKKYKQNENEKLHKLALVTINSALLIKENTSDLPH